MQDFKTFRTQLVGETFAGLSRAFQDEIPWHGIEYQLEHGHTKDVLHQLHTLVKERVDFASDVPKLEYIQSILRCNSMGDFARVPAEPPEEQSHEEAAQELLRYLGGVHRHIDGHHEPLDWNVFDHEDAVQQQRADEDLARVPAEPPEEQSREEAGQQLLRYLGGVQRHIDGHHEPLEWNVFDHEDAVQQQRADEDLARVPAEPPEEQSHEEAAQQLLRYLGGVHRHIDGDHEPLEWNAFDHEEATATRAQQQREAAQRRVDGNDELLQSNHFGHNHEPSSATRAHTQRVTDLVCHELGV